MEYKISVIVPIFKVEKFIERCALQLINQTMGEIQLIFVDDCSPDSSIDLLYNIVKEYPNKSQNILICHHEKNMGLPSARNTGLKFAKGEYIFHCDSDDWMERDCLELLYNKAMADNSEIVWCDWYLSFKNNERYMSQDPKVKKVFSGLEVIKLLLEGSIKYNVWNKLVKRELYEANNIQFPDGFGMGEDMSMIKLFAFAERVSYLPKALYHYVQLNSDAYTKTLSDMSLYAIKYNVDELSSFLKRNYGSQLDDYIHFFKLNVKLPFLISLDKSSYDRWNDWFKESNAYIDLNIKSNKRTQFLQKAALKRQYWLIKLYNLLVIKVVYGLIYN